MIKVDIRSKNVAYITIGKWVIYVDNSTGEHIIDSWEENENHHVSSHRRTHHVSSRRKN